MNTETVADILREMHRAGGYVENYANRIEGALCPIRVEILTCSNIASTMLNRKTHPETIKETLGIIHKKLATISPSIDTI